MKSRVKLIIYSSVVSILVLSLSGCGSSDAKKRVVDVNETDASIDNDSTDDNITINGKVVDGEISGATLYHWIKRVKPRWYT